MRYEYTLDCPVCEANAEAETVGEVLVIVHADGENTPATWGYWGGTPEESRSYSGTVESVSCGCALTPEQITKLEGQGEDRCRDEEAEAADAREEDYFDRCDGY